MQAILRAAEDGVLDDEELAELQARYKELDLTRTTSKVSAPKPTAPHCVPREATAPFRRTRKQSSTNSSSF